MFSVYSQKVRRMATLYLVLLFGLFIAPLNVEALVLAPAKIEIEAAQGNVVKDRVILLNDSEETVTYYSSVELFEAQGESGTPNFVSSNEGLSTWVEVPSSVTLRPNESKEIDYVLTIPGDAEPGGHFAAIFWSTLSPDSTDTGNVLIGFKSGILILLRVAGDISETGGVVDFKEIEGKRIFTSLPMRFFYRFENAGGDRLRPEGAIRIKNIFGSTASLLNANLTEGNVLPRSIRKYEVLWSEKTEEANFLHSIPEDEKLNFFAIAKDQWNNFLIGPYTAELDIDYGKDHTEDKSKFRFFVIPWQLTILLLATFSIILFGGRILLRRYNRWIIAQSRSTTTRKSHKRKK